jgi:hypothetical protein
MSGLTTWSGGLHLSYRLVPPIAHLKTFLAAENGAEWETIHTDLPFDPERSKYVGATADARRYRDAKQLYETAGLLFQEGGRVWFTELGLALKRFLPHLTATNAVLIGRHAALTLAACQLRNPTDAGAKYDEKMKVFPFRFIWMAMLELDFRINSDELNRALFRVVDEDSLREAISKIREFRRTAQVGLLGEETHTKKGKDDRIIPFVSLASFGWSLITDKRESPIPGYYCIRPHCVRLLEAAILTPVRHREYQSVREYAEHLSEAACLPRDFR